MGTSRFSLSSGGVRIVHSVVDNAERPQARKLTFGHRKYGGIRTLLAARVWKGGELSWMPAPFFSASMVVGLIFQDGMLEVKLLSSDPWMGMAGLEGLVHGPTFERFTNQYVYRVGSLMLAAEAISDGAYELLFDTNAFGDRLLLWNRETRTQLFSVNLSALFAVGPVIVHGDGRLVWDGHDVGRREWSDGELFPFVKFGSDGAAAMDFHRRGWQKMTEWTPLLEELQACERRHGPELEGRGGGTEERAAAEFRRLFSQLI